VTLLQKFLNVLTFILFAAGTLSMNVVADMIGDGGNPELGKAVKVMAWAMVAMLCFGSVFMDQKQRRAVKRQKIAAEAEFFKLGGTNGS
jgi:hypothetical protein